MKKCRLTDKWERGSCTCLTLLGVPFDSQVFRQKDQGFINMLNRFRVGQVDDQDVECMKQCTGSRPQTADHIEPTRLFPST